MFFLAKNNIPKRHRVIYLRIVTAFRPEKENPRRVIWTVGGDKVDYPRAVTTKTANLTIAKVHFNIVVSTPNAQFMAMDLKDFYLGTPMSQYNYIQVSVTMILQEIIDLYKLVDLIVNR